MPRCSCIKLWCSVLKYLVPILGYGWPCPPFLPQSCAAPFPPCAGTNQMRDLIQQKEIQQFPLPPVFPAKSISLFSSQHSCGRVVLLWGKGRYITMRETNRGGKDWQYFKSELPTSKPHCVSIFFIVMLIVTLNTLSSKLRAHRSRKRTNKASTR